MLCYRLKLYLPLEEYVTLPASKYSVLDGETVTRIDKDTFRVSLTPISFLNLKLQPILTLNVDVNKDGADITLRDCKLKGTMADVANRSFEAWI